MKHKKILVAVAILASLGWCFKVLCFPTITIKASQPGDFSYHVVMNDGFEQRGTVTTKCEITLPAFALLRSTQYALTLKSQDAAFSMSSGISLRARITGSLEPVFRPQFVTASPTNASSYTP